MRSRMVGIFNLPDSAYLGKRLFKKHFLENGILTPSDKKYLQDDVESIIWQYTLKPSTIQIMPYVDKEREYLEMAVLEVVLRLPKNYKRLAEVIHRTIPYPLLLVFSHIEDEAPHDEVIEEEYDNVPTDPMSKIALSMAPKRFSLAEKGAIVAEEFLTTEWIDMDSPTTIQRVFLDSLNVKDLPHTDFFTFYSELADRFIALDCASFRGEFQLDGKVDPEQRRKKLALCHELEGKIAEQRKKLLSETQFNNKLEHNMKIKQLEKQLQELSIEL